LWSSVLTSNNFGRGSIDGNHKLLLNVMSSFSPGLKVAHFNARSFCGNKVDYARYVFENSNIDVLLVSETWWLNDLCDSNFMINGYRLFRNDRSSSNENGTAKKGGGVAIYCKQHIYTKILARSVADSKVEYLCLEVSDSHSKILLGCVYNPSREIKLDDFFSELSPFLTNFDQIIIGGDFNKNLLINDSVCANFFDLAHTAGLHIVNFKYPTRFMVDKNPSLLDVFLVSDPAFNIHFSQCSFLSDHDLIFGIFNVVLSYEHAADTVTFRDYKNVDIDALNAELLATPWNDCLFLSTVDEKLNFITTKLNTIFNNHIPLKTIQVQRSSTPWFTQEVRDALKYRNKMYTIWRRKPSRLNWENFVSARKSAGRVTRSAKFSYYQSKLNASLSTKQLWRNVRKLSFDKKASENCCIDPESLNDFFASVSNSGEVFSSDSFDFDKYRKNAFQFSPVCDIDVLRCINKISTNAVGEDGLPIKFIKMVLPYVIGVLTHLINHIFTTCTFPSLWKIALITPIAKKSPAIDENDYRPVAILPCLSKVCEMLMAEQIREHFCENKLLSVHQSGFRPGHSCSTAIVKVLDDIRFSFDRGFITLLCLLDFSKAFDKVVYRLLIQKLGDFFGFNTFALKLIASYLCDRMQRVKVQEKISGYQNINSGVPQGSILGPILFTAFINDLLTTVQDCSIHAYADDVQIYLSRRIGLIEDLVARMNEDLCRVNNWAKNNCLALNPQKSCILPISKFDIPVSSISPVFVGDAQLNVVNKATNLGFVINSSLSCKDHINSVISKIYFTLRNLRRTAHFTPLRTKQLLVKQLILPTITYAEIVYSSLDSRSLQKLKVAFNFAARYIYNLKRFESVSNYVTSILGCTIETYIKYRNCIFMHKLINSKSPAYLYNKLHFSQSNRNITLILPTFQYSESEKLFFINAARLWNSLPFITRNISESSGFRTQVMNFFQIGATS